MLQDYQDILDMLSRQIRETHWLHYLWHDEGHEGAHPDCKSFSYDLLGKPDRLNPDGERCCKCIAKPGWHDEHGVPRFAAHHPTLAADIYATEVVLLRISCQACGEQFSVQMSWSLSGTLLARVKAAAMLGMPHVHPASFETEAKERSLAGLVRAGTIHYGDPPAHDCATGVTMNCWDLQVLEFWSRNRPVTGSHDWVRIAELEIALPDFNNNEHIGGAS